MDAEMTYCFAPDTSNREKYEAVMSQTVPTIKGGSEGTQNIIDQLVPKYHNFSFSFNNLMKCSPISKTVYSPIVSALGCEWRLKIYPDGNDDVRGKHLSIFVMMVNGQ